MAESEEEFYEKAVEVEDEQPTNHTLVNHGTLPN